VQTAKERFEEKFRVTPGCWFWTGCVMSNGYGGFTFNGGTRTAHKMSYHFYVGRVPQGLLLRHKCNNKLCVNPDHLTPGTHAENSADSVAAGTNHKPQGELHPKAKVTEMEVREMRDLAKYSIFSRRELALLYGLTPSTVSGIVTRRYWSHI